ncbi:MAG: metallophosphoesterase [Magnetococcales bacterium]|nr:metallophosphoesterase [Magnetococcales bacterium]
MRISMRSVGVVLVLMVVAALGTPPASGAAASGGVLAYVILGEKGHAMKGETVPIARLVLEHGQGFKDISCESLTMSAARGQSVKLATRPNPNPTELPVTLCEAVIPFAQTHQSRGESWTVSQPGGKSFPVQLPTVSRTPETTLILGDTGCRDTSAQKCADKDAQWPFPTVMASQMARQLQSREKPAVIIHVGDFKYRGKKDDTGTPKKWTNWKADFFQPMQGSPDGDNLFAMAPWVVARGNHELCTTMGNNGDGWYYLLDPTSSVAGDSPQQVAENSCKGAGDGMTRPYRLDFANGLSLVVADTANLYESREVCDADRQRLVKWYQEIERHFKGSGRHAWLVTHKPTWAVLGNCGKPGFSNATPQAAVEALDHHALPENLQLVLAGHKHLYTSMDVNPREEKRRILELVSGNGGVQLNTKAYSGCLKYNGGKHVKDFYAEARGMSRFGFIVGKLEGGQSVAGWKLQVKAFKSVSGGGDWGGLVTAEVCEFPVKTGKPACEIKEDALFARPCSSCDKVDDPDKDAKNCQSGEDDD